MGYYFSRLYEHSIIPVYHIVPKLETTYLTQTRKIGRERKNESVVDFCRTIWVDDKIKQQMMERGLFSTHVQKNVKEQLAPKDLLRYGGTCQESACRYCHCAPCLMDGEYYDEMADDADFLYHTGHYADMGDSTDMWDYTNFMIRKELYIVACRILYGYENRLPMGVRIRLPLCVTTYIQELAPPRPQIRGVYWFH